MIRTALRLLSPDEVAYIVQLHQMLIKDAWKTPELVTDGQKTLARFPCYLAMQIKALEGSAKGTMT